MIYHDNEMRRILGLPATATWKVNGEEFILVDELPPDYPKFGHASKDNQREAYCLKNGCKTCGKDNLHYLGMHWCSDKDCRDQYIIIGG